MHPVLSFRAMIRAVLGLAVVSLLAAPVPAVDQPIPTLPPDAHLTAAREALVAAQERLRLADTGKKDEYGGHRKLALELVNTALVEVDAGLKVVADDAARKAREAKEAESRKKRRRR